MRRHSTGSVIAMAAAAVLFAGGIAVVHAHGDHGEHGRPERPGRGGPAPHDGVSDDGDAPHGEAPHGGPHGGGGAPHAGGGVCDPAATAAVASAVALACPCGGVDDGQGGVTPWRNHGQYVRCVARTTRDQARAAGLKRRCVKRSVPCAARSTCGKGDAVACVVVSTATCVGGTCSDDPAAPCLVDADCASAPTCRVTSAAECAARGGTAGSGSCCAASPSGAFLDPVTF
jgi:hypothetical protein